MLIRLIRNQPSGYALTGTLYVDSLFTEEGVHQYELSMDTLEHMEYAIPDGFYRLRMTYSPRFQEVLPILDNVTTWMVGRVIERFIVHNSVVVVVQIESGEVGADDAPLLYHERQYLRPGDVA